MHGPTTSRSPRLTTGDGRRQTDERLLIPHIGELTELLHRCDRSELAAEAMTLRQELSRGTDPSTPEILVSGVSLAAEALRRAHGIELYDVQLLAVLHLARGCVAQMQTGEGKTFVAITTALHLAMAGRGVHVVTPNTYLAQRDCDLATAAGLWLDLSVGLLPEKVEAAEKKTAYDHHVTYGTGHEFGFDYLRDQLTLRREANAPWGARILRDLSNPGVNDRLTMQRGLAYAIVDEADSVLIDDAGSPLVLSLGSDQVAPDAEVHLQAREFCQSLEANEHFVIDHGSGLITLSERGQQACYSSDVAIPTSLLARPWTSYVEQALRAEHLYRRDVHYIVADDEVQIVDETTGRVFEDRSWQEGLHQAIEAREGLPISAENESVAQITRQRFFRLYQNLCGMTGTALGCEVEFQHVYKRSVVEIPLRRPSQRHILPTRFFATIEAKHAAIVQSCMDMRKLRRPVLVGTRSIEDSELISQRFHRNGTAHQILNGVQTREEAQIVAEAGQPGAITIATNLAGRGTDIILGTGVATAGGLHVIVAECQLSGRMDRQLIGRCARQGDPGSAQKFVSAQDSLLKRHGDWLCEAIERDADENEEAHSGFTAQLNRIQVSAELLQYQGRRELLRRDSEREMLLRTAD